MVLAHAADLGEPMFPDYGTQQFGIWSFSSFLKSELYSDLLTRHFGGHETVEGRIVTEGVARILNGDQRINDEKRQLLLDTPPISLLDAIELWLIHGDGFQYCPDYESYLQAVIVIIDNWLAWDRKYVAWIDPAPIWPPLSWQPSQGDPSAVPVPLVSSARDEGGGGDDYKRADVLQDLVSSPESGGVAIQGTIAPAWNEEEVLPHQALNRQHYLRLKAQRENRDQRRTAARLEQIAQHLGLPEPEIN